MLATSMFIFNVYICPINVMIMNQCIKLGILKAITDELDNTCYAIIGDWNANLCDIDNSLFAGHMINFCSENNFKISSCAHLPERSYT